MALGETLTSLRKAKGLSQEQLAEELNITRQTISKWELNQSTPDIPYILQLSDFFGVSTDYLIRGEEAKDIHSSYAGSESSDTEKVDGRSNYVNVYKWCLILGIVFIGISLIGIGALVICSALNPWGALFGGKYFSGLLGFLFGTGTFRFFIVLLVLLFLGCCAVAYGIVKNRKTEIGQITSDYQSTQQNK